MKLTEDQFNYLSAFEDRFRCAITSNYCRNIQSKDVIKIREIYEGILGHTYVMSINCSTCILGLIKRIAPIYFEYKEMINNGGEEQTSKRGRRKSKRTED